MAAKNVDGVEENLEENEITNSRPQRSVRLTEKGEEFQAELSDKKEKAFLTSYQQFKREIVDVRNQLKDRRTEDELFDLRQRVEEGARKSIDCYERLRRQQGVDLQARQRQVDTVEACARDIVALINTAISEVDVTDFDPNETYARLRTLKQPYAASVYSAATILSNQTANRLPPQAQQQAPATINDDNLSTVSSNHRGAQKADVTPESTSESAQATTTSTAQQAPTPEGHVQSPTPQAQIPPPQVQIPTTQVQIPTTQVQIPTPQVQIPTPQVQIPTPQVQIPTPQVQIPTPQVQIPTPQVQIPTPQVQISTPQVQNPTPEVQIPTPQVQIPTPQVQIPTPQVQIPTPQVQVPIPQAQIPMPQVQIPTPQVQIPTCPPQVPTPVGLLQSPSYSSQQVPVIATLPSGPMQDPRDTALAITMANIMDRNRLPIPTPKHFSGDPLEYTSFRRGFKTLVENKGITPEEMIYYLQQYLTGDAREAVAGCFHGTQHADYARAWQILEERFGHPFKIQEAYREQLDNWPKITEKDIHGLQKYADYLRSCLEATSHIRGLEILNDWKYSQGLVAKLPDTMIQRWSRVVTEHMDGTGEYPTFRRLVTFVEKEARVANNPIASISAVKSHRAGTSTAHAKAFNTSLTPDNTTKVKKCPFCSGGHYLPNCSTFAEKTDEEKVSYIKQSKRCFGCLRTGHLSRDCTDRHKCRMCGKAHPTVLHKEEIEESEPPTEVKSLATHHGSTNTTNIVPVWVSSKVNPQSEKLVYALLDTQSDSTFIDQGVCAQLQAPTTNVRLKLTTLLGRDSTVLSQRVENLRIRGYTSSEFIDLPPAYTRNAIPLDLENVPTRDTAMAWQHLQGIASELPPLLDIDIGLLIGYNCSHAFIPRKVVAGANNQPFAMKSDLGWSIVGDSTGKDHTNLKAFCHRVTTKETPLLTPQDALTLLERDFKDTGTSEEGISQDDLQFIETMEKGIHTNQKGNLEMPLPFKHRPKLPNNYTMALRRLHSLKRKFERDPEYKEEYSQFIQRMIEDGDCEMARSTQSEELWYIPHHGVVHPQKKKLRVVFDCSAKFNGISLNENLLQGPDLINDLFGILCRFRKNQYTVVCDIEKMFHRFHVNPEDRSFLRFLWWEDGDTKTIPKEFQMNVHLFGATSSPGCANFALKHIASSHRVSFPKASKFLQDNFYVDDGLTSVPTVQEAKELIQQTKEVCAEKKIRVHKFLSNSRAVIESVPPSERAAQVQNIDLNKGDLPTERALGIQWEIQNDSFIFKTNLKEAPTTRRGILSTVASIYDPLGLISPLVLRGKAILQETCKKGLSWDEPIPDHLHQKWSSWKADLNELAAIKIPRWYANNQMITPNARVELHHFCDASTIGYGTCSYLRFIDATNIHCTLVASKARVAPSKGMSIPRLELSAAVTATKLAKKIREELEMDISMEYFWSDSQVALAYINNDATRFHLFVANRVRYIRQNTRTEQWHYVATNENPADIASRGASANKLKDSNWFSGPEFLQGTTLPTTSTQTKLMVGDPEVKASDEELAIHKAKSCCTAIAKDLSFDVLKQLEKISSWERIVRVVARILRLSDKKIPNEQVITIEEQRKATQCIIKLIQRKEFREEIKMLEENKQFPLTNKILNLDPKLKNGVMVVGGRLENSSLEDRIKHPIILPGNNHFTRLIIAHHHAHHQGRAQALNHLRSQGFWITSGSRSIERFLKNCIGCRKLRRPVQQQKMADLPAERVNPSPPFTFVGMDCFGPFSTTEGRKQHKRYGLLLTCLCSRAVHIEMLPDMTTDALIVGLRCFISIRGTVSQITCDQGSNFIGANNEFKTALRELDTERMTAYLAKQQCDFKFNAPHSSHAGGVWERQIRSIRNIMNSTTALVPGRLDDFSLRCLFYEAMSIVNSRPLTTLGNDPHQEPITPNHLLTMKSTQPLPPPGQFVREDLYARKRWRRIQYLMEQFWSRWRKEYILQLSMRQKWKTAKRNVKVGDIVLVVDEAVPRMEWPLAMVTDVKESNDGLVRRVKLRVGNRNLDKHGRATKQASILERPIQKIVVLVEN